MFTQFPDAVYKAQLSPSVPIACVKVIGDMVTTAIVERQVGRICSAPSWKWKAIPQGDNAFLLGFLYLEDLQRVDGLELGVPLQAVKLILT